MANEIRCNNNQETYEVQEETSYFCLFPSTGSIGTSLASQSSHLHNAFFDDLPASFFSLFFIIFQKSLLYPNFCFWGPFFTCTSLEHLPQTQHSKAQSALHKSAKQLRDYQRATTQASRRSWREVACRTFTQFAALSKRINRNTRGKNIRPLTKHLKLVWCAEDLPLFPITRRYNTALSLRHFYVFRTCMRRPGDFLGAWSSSILQAVSLHLRSWTSLSASLAFCFVLYVLNDCSGGNSTIATCK